MSDLIKSDTGIIMDVLLTCWGYPVHHDNLKLLDFDRQLCGKVREKLNRANDNSYNPDKEEKHIILKSFEIFLLEMTPYDESLALTNHTKLEVQELYEKLKEMYKD